MNRKNMDGDIQCIDIEGNNKKMIRKNGGV